MVRVKTAGDVALVIRDTRQRKGLTQGGLAAAIGVTRQAIAGIESGRTVPHLTTALAALEALGLRIDIGPPDADGPGAEGTESDPGHESQGPVDLDAVLAALRAPVPKPASGRRHG